MNFFEKAVARARAQELLGLTGHPDQEEIRAGYRKLALSKHPDHGDGTDDEFARINAAYSLLKEDKGFTGADVLHTSPIRYWANYFPSEGTSGQFRSIARRAKRPG